VQRIDNHLIQVDKWCNIHNFGARALRKFCDRGESEIAEVDAIVHCEGHASRDRVLRVEVLREEASIVSLKLLKPEVLKSLIVIDCEGGHVSVDRELLGKSALGKSERRGVETPKARRAEVVSHDDITRR
jgi:hypothetical protein